MGRQHEEELLVATEYKSMEGDYNGQGYMEANCRGGQGPLRVLL